MLYGFCASFGIKLVYRYLSLYHLFCFWNSALFTLNVHVSHFCSDQKPGHTTSFRVQSLFFIIKPWCCSKLSQVLFCEESPAFLKEAAVVSKPHNNVHICWSSQGNLSSPPPGRSQFSVSSLTAAAALVGNFISFSRTLELVRLAVLNILVSCPAGTHCM